MPNLDLAKADARRERRRQAMYEVALALIVGAFAAGLARLLAGVLP